MAEPSDEGRDVVDARESVSDSVEEQLKYLRVSDPPKPPAVRHLVDDDFTYNMHHPRRGEALIINNKIFRKSTGMGTRNGTDVDAARMKQLFDKLGFETTWENNLNCRDMKIEIEKMAYKNFSDADCFALAILSHGDDGVVYGTDGIISLDDILKPLKKCHTLVGKPKLFFIQACRGYYFDDGVELSTGYDQIDAMPASKRRIPQEADVLLACSTVPGYYSWRNAVKGSWFVQAICDVFNQHSDTMELMHMMTRVINKVAFDFQSAGNSEKMSNKKQCPSITTQLTKDLYFTPKQKKLAH